MNNFLEKPAVVAEARKRQKGQPIIIEILVFLGVFILASLGELIIMIPGELAMIYTNSDYTSALAAGDTDMVTQISSEIASSNIYSILTLFATLGMILVIWLFCKFFQKRKLSSLGFKKEGIAKEYGIGALAGFGAFSAAVLICVMTGSVTFTGLSSTFSIGFFLLFVIGYMIQGMSEEMMCRGYFMVSVARRSTMFVAIMANALIFSCLHLFNTGISVLAFINLILFSVFASVYFMKRGNIWGVAAFHSVWNLVQGNIYGIHVSGTTTNCTLFSTTSVEGNELWNGGVFGLEGGLAVTIVLVAGIAFLCTRKAIDVEAEAEPVTVESPTAEAEKNEEV